jgi:methylthioribulose-1-phosphate dehydratase
MPPTPLRASSRSAAATLVAIGRRFYARGWVMGTSGNFSIVTSRRPLRLAITSSGAHKGTLMPRQILEIDEHGRVRRGAGRSSAETRLHLAIVRATGAGAVLHTHSVWSTILSERHQAAGGLALEGREMLKGLEGVTTHEHREWLPVVANAQDMQALSLAFEAAIARRPAPHGVLIAGHGLYTWGRDAAEAERHVEILEFLLEVEGRSQSWPS